MVTSDIDIHFVGEKCLQDVLVSSLSTEMESSVPVSVSAGDLSALLQKSDHVLIVTRVGSSNKFIIPLLVLVTFLRYLV